MIRTSHLSERESLTQDVIIKSVYEFEMWKDICRAFKCSFANDSLKIQYFVLSMAMTTKLINNTMDSILKQLKEGIRN